MSVPGTEKLQGTCTVSPNDGCTHDLLVCVLEKGVSDDIWNSSFGYWGHLDELPSVHIV